MFCIGNHVVIFAMNWHEPFGLGNRQIHFQIFSLGMARGVHVGNARVHHFSACAQQTIDNFVDVLFIAWNCMAGENDGVARPHLDELVVASRQQ